MEFNDATVWWLLAGTSVALELLHGTFYLLMLALGLAAGAITAHAGGSSTWQFSAAALVGGAAVLIWHRIRTAGRVQTRDAANPDLHMDVGATVQVDHWDADGTARVKYRGAAWTVFHAPGITPEPGPHRVTEVVGSRLQVDRL